MKKLLVAAVIAVCALGSAAAERVSVKGLNLSFPYCTKSITVDDDDVDGKVDLNSFGYGINYQSMSAGSGNWGFSSIFGVGLGAVNAELGSDDAILSKPDFTGGNFNLKWGWGIAPVSNERVVLGIHGMIGFDFFYGTTTINSADAYLLDFDFWIGADCLCAIKLSGNFALTAGLDLVSNFYGAGGFGVEGNLLSDSWSFSYTASGITAIPRVGISWVF